jgi:hypothetical protein
MEQAIRRDTQATILPSVSGDDMRSAVAQRQAQG